MPRALATSVVVSTLGWSESHTRPTLTATPTHFTTTVIHMVFLCEHHYTERLKDRSIPLFPLNRKQTAKSHTHTHTHKHMHAHKRTYAHSCTHTHTHTHTHTQCVHMAAQKHTQKFSHTHTHTYTYTHKMLINSKLLQRLRKYN